MKWASVSEDFMVQVVTDEDPEGRYPPHMVWSECPDNVEAGWWWYYQGEFTTENPSITLYDVVVAKSVELRQKCDDVIARIPFSSEALGAVYNYDCRSVDQANIQLRYLTSLHTGQNEPLWASDGTRYAWLDHTSDEMIEVMVAMNEHIKINQIKLASKLATVDAASTKDVVRAISW